jgi:hypothetical protein
MEHSPEKTGHINKIITTRFFWNIFKHTCPTSNLRLNPGIVSDHKSNQTWRQPDRPKHPQNTLKQGLEMKRNPSFQAISYTSGIRIIQIHRTGLLLILRRLPNPPECDPRPGFICSRVDQLSWSLILSFLKGLKRRQEPAIIKLSSFVVHSNDRLRPALHHPRTIEQSYPCDRHIKLDRWHWSLAF